MEEICLKSLSLEGSGNPSLCWALAICYKFHFYFLSFDLSYRFRYGIRAKGSFYNVFITAKTFDNVMYDDDDSDIIGSNDNDDNYPNIVHPHRNPSYKVSEVEMRVKGGASPRAVEEEGPKRYLSHLPSVRNNEREEGQYIDLINPFFPTSFSDYELSLIHIWRCRRWP